MQSATAVQRCASGAASCSAPANPTRQSRSRSAIAGIANRVATHHADLQLRPLCARKGYFEPGCRGGLLPAGASDGDAGPVPIAAVEGDIVTVHYVCKDRSGEVIESSYDTGEAATFEIGAGEIIGNKLFQTFDASVRGLAVGDKTAVKVSGGEWQRDLLFTVPRSHEEMQRLAKRHESSGGLQQGLLVELANGQPALVVATDDETIQLDANNMLAGKELTFELELMNIEKGV